LEFRALKDLWTSQFQESDSTNRAEILGCELETIDGNPYGLVISGCLRLCSLWLDLEQWREIEHARIQTREEESSLLNRYSNHPAALDVETLKLDDEHIKETVSEKNGLVGPQSDQDSASELNIEQLQVGLESLSTEESNVTYEESESSSNESNDSEELRLKESSLRRGELLVNLDQQRDILQKDERKQLGMIQILTTLPSRRQVGRIIYCLLLEPGKRKGTYRRIGLVEVPDLPEFLLKP
jgi:hypothetical protein